MRPRKDYGSPLRIYQDAHDATMFTIFPPRSHRAEARYRRGNIWNALHVRLGFAGIVLVPMGGHGQRITWAELPPAVQATLRASFLGEYCPKGEA